MWRIVPFFAFVLSSCTGRIPVSPPQPRTIDDSLAAASAFLVKQQSTDGAWRSDVYGTFKDGPALTPFAVVALQAAGTFPEARLRGAAYLAGMAKPDGTIEEGPDGFDFPVYTAALSVIALSHAENQRHLPARNAWLKYLLDRQLTEKLGWHESDKEFGGWGYCRTLPRKPQPNRFAPPLIESNLSATVFALEALKAAGVRDEVAFSNAGLFVQRCRNPDGGFHFIDGDPIRNKAGSDDGTPPGFHSYGSATADGIRALEMCNLDASSSRAWLLKHFRPDSHPGDYIPSHVPNREAVYFYYAASVAKALHREGKVDERSARLAEELMIRQRSDGCWVNGVELVRENDPVVATCHAVIALAECRDAKGK